MAAGSDKQPTPLATAYEQRSAQLYEARGALAEAVSALTIELDRGRQELAASRAELSAAAADNRAVREYVSELEAALRENAELVETLRSMKVIRWTKWPRSVIYRLRGHP